MVEDDIVRLRSFGSYAKGRGDLSPFCISFASELKDIVQDLEETKRILDVALLDVRLPAQPADTRKLRPEQFAPLAAEIADVLARSPATSAARLIVYTQYRYAPDVQKVVNQVQQHAKNVVRVYDRRPEHREAICVGLKAIQQVNVGLRPRPGTSTEFEIHPTLDTSPQDLAQAEFLLNGGRSMINEPFQDQTHSGRLVCFEESARFSRDVNYLMVRLGTRKSFFPLDAPSFIEDESPPDYKDS